MLDIKKYEAMAKLDLPEGERKSLSSRVDFLIESFGALDDIDVSGVEPLVTVLDISNAMREDNEIKVITRDELLSNAPEQYGGYFQVPKTVD